LHKYYTAQKYAEYFFKDRSQACTISKSDTLYEEELTKALECGDSSYFGSKNIMILNKEDRSKNSVPTWKKAHITRMDTKFKAHVVITCDKEKVIANKHQESYEFQLLASNYKDVQEDEYKSLTEDSTNVHWILVVSKEDYEKKREEVRLECLSQFCNFSHRHVVSMPTNGYCGWTAVARQLGLSVLVLIDTLLKYYQSLMANGVIPEDPQ
jgi:phosphopantetheinyl transferase (holo-ACP synthase)